MRFRFIDAERAGLAMPIFRLCRLLQVSVSGFYAWSCFAKVESTY